jgi:hypothetical protein
MVSIALSPLTRFHQWRTKYSVVRWPLLLVMAGLWLCSRWLKNEYGQEDSTLWIVMELFFRLLVWIILGLTVTSIFTALTSWLYFRYQISNQQIQARVKLGDGLQAEAGLVPVGIQLHGPLIRPLLGTVQTRLFFSKEGFSEAIVLDENVRQKNRFWRMGIQGTGTTLLNDRRIYDVETVEVSFYDMLGLISLPASLPSVQQLFTVPVARGERLIHAQPNSTEEQKHRIEIPKRVEGEHVNYKEFESGDNIQRIVWKIYAKSGQLVVRIPETKDPYASHLYFYVSYYHGYEPGSLFDASLLNAYKDQVRHLMESIERNGYDVRIPQDQEVPKISGIGDKKNQLFQISAASWHAQWPPAGFVQPSKAAMVCVSSCVPAVEIETLANKLAPNIPLIIVKLSQAIPSPFRLSLKDIFFKPPSRPVDHLRQPWLLAPLRRALQKNEKQLENLIKKRDRTWLVDTIETIR